MKQSDLTGKNAKPCKDSTDFTQFIERLKAQMKDGVDISQIFLALMQEKWKGYFSAVSIEECKKTNVAQLIGEAIANDSPAMFEIALNLSGKRLGKGIVHHIWSSTFQSGDNAILKHLLDKSPVALCALISQFDLFCLLCSFVKKAAIGIGDYQSPHPCFLQEVELPRNIDTIPPKAFEGWGKLASINIPDGVTEIGNEAFNGCTSLASVTMPDSVTKIGDGAFWGCTSLDSVTMPDGVTKIGNHAFFGCTSLASVTIPDSVTEIGDEAFNGCTSLASVTIPRCWGIQTALNLFPAITRSGIVFGT